MNQHYENAQTAATNYGNASSISDFNNYSKQYYDEKNSYEEYRTKNSKIVTKMAIAIPLGVIASAGLIYLSKKITRPVYTETPLLTLNNIVVNKDFSSVYSIGLGININKK